MFLKCIAATFVFISVLASVLASAAADRAILDLRTKVHNRQFYYDIGKEIAEKVTYPLLPQAPQEVSLKKVFVDPGDTPPQVLETIRTGLDGEKLMVFGPFGDANLEAFVADDILIKDSVVAFAPVTEGTAIRKWTPSSYFTDADPYAELLALLKYSINTLGVRRIGVMYVTGSGTGEEQLRFLDEYVKNSLVTIAAPYKAASPTEDVDNDQFADFLGSNPSVAFLLGGDCAATEKFFTKLITTPLLGSVTMDIFMPFALQWRLAQVLRDTTTDLNVDLDRIHYTSTSGFASTASEYQSNRFPSMDTFIAHLKEYLGGPELSIYCTASGLDFCSPELFDDTALPLVATGWVDAQMLLHATSRFAGTTRQDLVKYLFNARRYGIQDDIFRGDYMGPCDNAVSTPEGIACSCNQGGHFVILNQFVDLGASDDKRRITFKNIPEGDYSYPFSTCYAKDAPRPTVTIPIVSSFFSFSGSDSDQYLSQSFAVGAKAGTPQGTTTTEPTMYRYREIPTTVDAAQAALDEATKHNIITTLIGVFPKSMSHLLGILFADSIKETAELHYNVNEWVYFSPTLEQELHVLAAYLRDNKAWPRAASAADDVSEQLHLLVKDTEDGLLKGVVPYAFSVFNNATIPFSSVIPIVSGTPLANALPESGTVVVVGLLESDVADVARKVESATGLTLVLAFDEVTRHYASLVAELGTVPTSVTDRVLFATSLPHWHSEPKPPPPGAELLEQFLGNVTDAEQRNPAAFRGFMVSNALYHLSRHVESSMREGLLDALYRRNVLSVGGMVFGPFNRICSVIDGATHSGGCTFVKALTNYGGRSIAVWSFSRALDSNVPYLAPPVTPVMPGEDVPVPSPPPTTSTTTLEPNTTTPPHDKSPLKKTGSLAGIVVAVVVVAVALIAGAVVLLVCCCAGDARDNRNAPKDAEVPVTLVFTDIQSSTALWSMVPLEMGNAVAQHHKMIRALIVKYRCYEVKTIGDSFMIACRDAFSAVQLVRDLQVGFLRHDWGTTKLDDTYRLLEEKKLKQSGQVSGEECDGAREAGGAATWSGLRVRVGMHTGLADIRYDEVTKGYDYYGDTSNTAARTESIGAGGQAIMTEFTYNALLEHEVVQFDLEALGPQHLRGVPEAIDMYQLNCVPGREFPVLDTSDAAAGAEGKPVDVGVVAHCGSGTTFEGTTPAGGVDAGASSSPAEMLRSEEELEASAKPAMEVLDVYFGPYNSKQKIKMLSKTCRKFNITIPPPPQPRNDDAYAVTLIGLVALRTTSVVAFRRNLEESDRPATAPLSATRRSRDGQRGSVTQQANKWDVPVMDAEIIQRVVSKREGDVTSNDGNSFVDSRSIDRALTNRAASHFTNMVSSDINCGATSEAPSFAVGRQRHRSASFKSVAGSGVSGDGTTSDGRTILMLDNGELLTLPSRASVISMPSDSTLPCDGEELSGRCRAASFTAGDTVEFHGDRQTRLSTSRSDVVQLTPSYIHEGPTFEADVVAPCFEGRGNGLLFRLANNTMQRWAMYNDTADLNMHVFFSLGTKSSVEALGKTTLAYNDETKRIEGTLMVAPRSTELLFEGVVNGYKFKYTATLFSN